MKEIQKDFSFADKSASGVKMTCGMCADSLYDHYDLEDQDAKRDYVERFRLFFDCDKELVKKIYKAVNGK